MRPSRCLILAFMALAACATRPPPGELAAVPGAAPLPSEQRMVLDPAMQGAFRNDCLAGARQRQSEAVAVRYCSCVLETAQTYVPPEEWTDMALPGKTARPAVSTGPISPIFSKVASGCGALVQGQ